MATAQIGVRLPPALREAIEREAAQGDLTMTDQIRTLLHEALTARAARKIAPPQRAKKVAVPRIPERSITKT
jgi:hypothetical protein